MFPPSQRSSAVPNASRPLADFSASRQPSLQEQMNILQQNEHKSIQNEMQSQLRHQSLALPEISGKPTQRSPRIAPNSSQASSSSVLASALPYSSASEHIKADVNEL
jgi:hypothetical protein